MGLNHGPLTRLFCSGLVLRYLHTPAQALPEVERCRIGQKRDKEQRARERIWDPGQASEGGKDPLLGWSRRSNSGSKRSYTDRQNISPSIPLALIYTTVFHHSCRVKAMNWELQGCSGLKSPPRLVLKFDCHSNSVKRWELWEAIRSLSLWMD